MRLIPFSKNQIIEISKKYKTPFYIYDEKSIITNARKLKKAFSWNCGFKEYFAIKALPNPYILKLLKKEGFGCDCSSLAELILAQKVEIGNENIIFTSNNTPLEEFIKAIKLGAIINLDDITHIDFLLENDIKFPKTICFRYNPGNLKNGNSIIGNPIDAKFGLTKDQLILAYKKAKKLGTTKFGIHTMVASNDLNPNYFIETTNILIDTILEIEKKIGMKFDFVNIGGGFGIPYKPGEKELDIDKISLGIKKIFDEKIYSKKRDLKLFLELGRYITGPYGYLITKAIHKKNTYKNYIGVDASMANLMRPGMYGAYHEILRLGMRNQKISRQSELKKSESKENKIKNFIYDIVGSLCENNDKFAIDRQMSKIDIGDYLVICDCGAHAHSMGFQYNGKLRSAELLLKSDNSIKLIRRAENLDDYFSTLYDF